MVTLLAPIGLTAVYPNTLCILLCIRKLELFRRLDFLILVGELLTWYHSMMLTAISARTPPGTKPLPIAPSRDDSGAFSFRSPKYRNAHFLKKEL